ncbi:glycosyltransferase family 4 protein [Microbacterium sp. HA-8]|uniref:glycosyltransferase family 4 protein n=1 Tax=Microbacterium sp. HA-8 TaxID=3234200 RepID=UPI0038F7D4B5
MHSDAPRRIALVCDYSLDYLGGAQSAFLDEAHLLRARGHEVTIVAPVGAFASVLRPAVGADDAIGSGDAVGGGDAAGAHWRQAWLRAGGDIVAVYAPLTVPGVDLPVIRNSRMLRSRLRAEFAARRIEVVHAHSEFGLTAAAVSSARALGLRTVQTVHTFFWQAVVPAPATRIAAGAVRGFGRWLRGFPTSHDALAPAALDSALRNLTLSMARRVDLVVSPSAHQAERLRAAGLRRVSVVPNAVASIGPAGEPLTAIDAPLRIVWVGRLVAEKRLLEWIDAVARACAALGPDALVVEIIGEGLLRGEAERRAGGLPIVFAGRLERGEVQRRMRGAHLVALTSHGFDNQPVTIVEALHARRGVFYVDPALTEGVAIAGLRAAGPDVEAMAALLVSLARDPAPVVRASEQAADGARDFDPETHVTRLLDVYAGGRTA